MIRWLLWCTLCLLAWAVPEVPRPTGTPTPSASPPVQMQLPNRAWSRVQGEVVRQVDGGLWFARTNGAIPVGSILSVLRHGVRINGARVLETDRKGIFLEPWAADAIQAGDQLHLESVVAPLP